MSSLTALHPKSNPISARGNHSTNCISENKREFLHRILRAPFPTIPSYSSFWNQGTRREINRVRALRITRISLNKRNPGRIHCVHIADWYWRLKVFRRSSTDFRQQDGASKGLSPHVPTPSPAPGYLSLSGSLQPLPGSPSVGRGKVSCVLCFCSLSPHPSYDLLGIRSPGASRRAPSCVRSGPRGGIYGFQGAPPGCRPDARSPAQPPAPYQEEEDAFLGLALLAFCCTVPGLRVPALTPGQGWEVSEPSPCWLPSSPAAPSCCSAYGHHHQPLFPGRGWEVSQTHPGWLISASADGHQWPRSVEESRDDPPKGRACVWRLCQAEASVLFGALSAGVRAYHHHVPWEAQKPAPQDHPGGALSNGGQTRRWLVTKG